MHSRAETDPEQDALAKTLAEAPVSAAGFDRLIPAHLSDEGLIDALVATERLVRHALGQQAGVLGALAARQARENSRTAGVIESEVIAATRWAATTVQRRLHEAGRLSARFPETLALLRAGQVSWPQALGLVETTGTLDRDTARTVQARVLPACPVNPPPPPARRCAARSWPPTPTARTDGTPPRPRADAWNCAPRTTGWPRSRCTPPPRPAPRS